MDFDKIFIQCHRAMCRYLLRIFDDRFRSDFNSFKIAPRVIIRKDNYWRSISIRFLSNTIVPRVIIFLESLRIDFDQIFNEWRHATWPYLQSNPFWIVHIIHHPSSQISHQFSQHLYLIIHSFCFFFTIHHYNVFFFIKDDVGNRSARGGIV